MFLRKSMELPRGARRCEKADSIGGEWGFLRRSFLREWERFAGKVGAVYPPPSARPFFKGLHNSHVKTLTLRKVSSPASSFRAQREIFLAQRSSGKCEMTNSTYAILSFPHTYRIPLGRKRSLGYAFDDDTRGWTVSHCFSSRSGSQPPPLRGTSFQRKEGKGRK